MFYFSSQTICLCSNASESLCAQDRHGGVCFQTFLEICYAHRLYTGFPNLVLCCWDAWCSISLLKNIWKGLTKHQIMSQVTVNMSSKSCLTSDMLGLWFGNTLLAYDCSPGGGGLQAECVSRAAMHVLYMQNWGTCMYQDSWLHTQFCSPVMLNVCRDWESVWGRGTPSFSPPSLYSLP